MLPSQILLNNLLYDVGQTTIPTDRVDEELLARPSAWDVRFIRRFMSRFGPISSLFDFMTFGVLWYLQAGTQEFRTGWFIESLATQTLVIFVIRTRRSPFFRSRPSAPLAAAIAASVLVGTALPFSPLGPALGFTSLPWRFFVALAALLLAYLAVTELFKARFYRMIEVGVPLARRAPPLQRRIHRRAARFSVHRPLRRHGGPRA